MSGRRPGARWLLKKTARAGVMFGSWGTGLMALRRMSGSVARALTYHRIGYDPYNPFCVHPAEFEAQMRMLAEQRRAVSLRQIMDFVGGTGSLPADACLVTIDDGMLSTLTEALPILTKWNVPAVAFVSAKLVGRAEAAYDERYLTWPELRELAASGIVEVGSHSFSHRSLGLMPPDEARQEIAHSREVLGQGLGREITAFAYPFGTRNDFNDHTESCLRDAGYSIAFHSMHGVLKPGANRLSLPRVKVEGGESLFQFGLVGRGGTDLWRAVDNTLWRLQRSRVEVD
jgi:peptidoglycan/xylan/chitin deacetylase (PgdA/CDA1 family)